jgi:hypothetical protein
MPFSRHTKRRDFITLLGGAAVAFTMLSPSGVQVSTRKVK